MAAYKTGAAHTRKGKVWDSPPLPPTQAIVCPRPLSPGRMGEYWDHIGDSWHCILSIKCPRLFLLKRHFCHGDPGAVWQHGMIFPLSCPESLRVITAQTLPKVTISNDQALGPQFNAPGVYIKINNFDLAFFQGQCLIDKIQCASLYLFMVGTELFHLSHDCSGTYGLSSFGWFIICRNRSSTGG